MAKLALALLAAPAVAFVAPGQQAASKVVVKGDIGVDPGPIDPSGFMFEDTEGLALRRAVITLARLWKEKESSSPASRSPSRGCASGPELSVGPDTDFLEHVRCLAFELGTSA